MKVYTFFLNKVYTSLFKMKYIYTTFSYKGLQYEGIYFLFEQGIYFLIQNEVYTTFSYKGVHHEVYTTYMKVCTDLNDEGGIKLF
jgi:hypothetical protein